MKDGRVVQLGSRPAFSANVLLRIVAQRGFHTVDRGGYTSDVLRIIPGSVSEEVLAQLSIVWIDQDKGRIAKVEEVRKRADGEFDLFLTPFGAFNQTGPGGSIRERGVHLLYGPVHHKPPYRARMTSMDHGSYKPTHFTPHSA